MIMRVETKDREPTMAAEHGMSLLIVRREKDELSIVLSLHQDGATCSQKSLRVGTRHRVVDRGLVEYDMIRPQQRARLRSFSSICCFCILVEIVG